jgi:folylpolyglutamate synthase/dihydrofolate synthase
VIESVKEAMQYVLRIQGRRTVYCLGSLYLTGMIKEIIQESLSGCGEV